MDAKNVSHKHKMRRTHAPNTLLLLNLWPDTAHAKEAHNMQTVEVLEPAEHATYKRHQRQLT